MLPAWSPGLVPESCSPIVEEPTAKPDLRSPKALCGTTGEAGAVPVMTRTAGHFIAAVTADIMSLPGRKDDCPPARAFFRKLVGLAAE